MKGRVVTKEELPALAREVVEMLPSGKESATILALAGDLGAGKTTFTQALGRALGIEEPMQSPTYVIMKKYSIHHPPFKTLVHIDAYRLNGAEEFAPLKPEEFLMDPAVLVCIEWPERIEGVLHKPDLMLRFSSENQPEGNRYIHIE